MVVTADVAGDSVVLGGGADPPANNFTMWNKLDRPSA